MNTPPASQPQDTGNKHVPPPAKARLLPGDTQRLVPPNEQDRFQPAPVYSVQRRLSPLQIAALGAVMLGLLALVAWGLFWPVGSPPPATEILPDNPVALINSSTPIANRNSPLTVRDIVDDISYAPESVGWTPALIEARRAQEEGRYASAISQYSALVGNANPVISHDALWGLASAYADAGQTDLAIRSYALFTYLRDDPRAARAYFKMGQIEGNFMHLAEAAASYDEYLRYAGPARHSVMLHRAYTLGVSPDAEALYKTVLSENPQPADLRRALLGLAQVTSVLYGPTQTFTTTQTPRDPKEALKIYDRLTLEEQTHPRPILDNAGTPPEVLTADEASLLGDKADAHKRLLSYISSSRALDYPAGRYAALDALLKLDPTAVVSGTVGAMEAAKIAYDAGYYGPAVNFLGVLHAQNAPPDQGAEVALLTGKSYSAMGDSASAYGWYTNTVQRYPASSQAADALRRAGDALADQSAWDAALGTYRQAVERYPAAPATILARLHGAVLAYRLEQREDAIALLGTLTSTATLSPTLRAEAAFWAGKVQKSLGNSEWKSNLAQVTKLAPGSYLDFRARSLVGGEPGGGPLAPTFTETLILTSSLGINYAGESAERRELLDWAARIPSTTTVTTTTPLATPGTDHAEARLVQDREVQRMAALVRLGDDQNASVAVRALAERLRDAGDASALAQLLLYVRYHASPSTGMRVAEALASLDPEGDPLKRPRLLLKSLYPTPYSGLVLDEAWQRGIDPFVMYALMRQESEFIPRALSHAGARGLAQVMPSTGDGIASQLGDGHYSAEDLYLPYVAIRYGTYYLASNLPQFDRKLLPALAAYNGGPGNAERWMSGSALFDPDLYVERIDLFETGDYLERVYQNYGFYRSIYRQR